MRRVVINILTQVRRGAAASSRATWLIALVHAPPFPLSPLILEMVAT